jgi:SET domain-containing protein
MNHSCNPNAELSHDEGKMYVDVIRTILPGQQITIDYGWSHEVAIPCECGSRHCRGWIVAADELHLLHRSTATDGIAI